MKFFKNINFHVVALIFIALFVVFTYWNLPSTFFQQDEWQSLAGSTYYQSKGIMGIIESFFPPDAISHFNPFAIIYSWFMFLLFYTDFTSYAWLSIGLHILNTFLLYYFVSFWLKNKKIAFISALFFGVNSIPSQAVTWVQAANSYEMPTMFIILSLLFFHWFLAREQRRKTYLILSLVTLFISLLFHENGIFLFLFYPIIFFLYAKPDRKKILQVFCTGIIFTFVILIFIRIPFFFGLLNPLPVVTDISHPPISVYPYRIISIGMKSFAGALIPEKSLINVSDEVVRLGYPQFVASDNVPNPYVSQSIVFDLVSYIITVLLVLLIILLRRTIREKDLSSALLWSLFFIPTSLLPYAFVLGKAGYASIIEPKFFYVASIGISILIAVIFYALTKKFSKQRIFKIIVVILFGLYLFSHTQAIRSNVNNLIVMGARIKTFLNEIKNSYQNLPQEVIFFTQSDTAYYGMPDTEKVLPVQIGFGKMLMVWYQKDEKFPGCLYEDQYLLRVLEEDYRYCDGRGFGYFRDYEKLVKSIKANNIPVENVISYSWKGKTEEFKDISQEIRMKLKNDLESL